MQIKILGCSGGIGGNLRTTSILVDHDILLDAGSGVGDLTMDELLLIDHIFVTHSHLDHIAFIPLLLDTVMGIRTEPVTLHATQDVINLLRAHIFNWAIWPDFNAIPNQSTPLLRYNEIKLGETLDISGRKFTPLPVNHVVPAVGYHVEGEHYSLVYTGDTAECDALWYEVNKISNLKYVIIETAFSNSEIALARLSKHLCPLMLETELAKLDIGLFKQQPEVYITHLKPGEDEMIMHEIESSDITLTVKALSNQQVFHL
jgi:ribonuclease BN (tRNA processing enzyme)